MPKRSRSTVAPLTSVVACLTGMAVEEKETLHAALTELGASYTRDFSTDNTHLVAAESSRGSAKFQAATTMMHIRIVSPSWIEACAEAQEHVDEVKYSLFKTVHGKKQPYETISAALSRLCGSSNAPTSCLFSSCHFFVAGFPETSPILFSMKRMMRRCMGTVHWSFRRDTVTHVVVNDGYIDETTREAILHNPRGAVLVTVQWVVDSLNAKRLLRPSRYLPDASVDEKKGVDKSAPIDTERLHHPGSSKIFNGCLFVILRVGMSDWAVDFEPKDLENIVIANGGQLLSQKLLDALRADSHREEIAKRLCYVLSWGPRDGLNHPLLAHVERLDLCILHHVTPIWLLTCDSEHKCIPPSRHPRLFQANHRPIHRFAPRPSPSTTTQTAAATMAPPSKLKRVHAPPLRLSVTGFSGSRRAAIVVLITVMGGQYDDAMKTSTTHLICHEPVGQKYEKAVEWKLHIVTLEWLYHVADHGRGNESSLSSGLSTEERFAVPPTKSV